MALRAEDIAGHPALHRAVEGVSEWPEVDLFSRFE